MINLNNPDIIAITEVIPKAQLHPISEVILHIQGYNMFTNFTFNENNPGAKGIRGIAIYVKDCIQANEIFLTAPTIEHLWLSINLKGNDKLIFGCIYRSPSLNLASSTEDLSDLLRRATNTPHSHIVITGDFNYKGIDWDNWSPIDSPNSPSKAFIEGIQDCFLFQHVMEPTRYRHGQEPHILDLVLSNEEGMVTHLEYLPGLWKSDHVCLLFTLTCHKPPPPKQAPRPNYHRGNYEAISQGLNSEDWIALLVDKTFKDAWDSFEHKLSKLTKDNIPLSRKQNKKKNTYMTREALKLSKLKNDSWSKYTASSSEVDKLRFIILRNKLRSLTRKLRHDHEYQLAINIKLNPKAFWKYTNSRLKTRSKIADLTRQDGSIATTEEDKAELLNEFFSSVFTLEDKTNLPHMEDCCSGQQISDIFISSDTVGKKLAQLLPNKTPGPDGWHPRLLRETGAALTLPLYTLFQKSMDTGTLPPSWKTGHITPIHKKGKKSNANNYRPVSLTSVFSKLMESLIRDHIIDHMMTNGLFADEQHGFVPGRSCTTQLLTVLEEWTAYMEDGECIDAIYLDFKKAFDTVPHERLLTKLAAYGIKGKILNWIRNFLVGRSQRVMIGEGKSTWADVTSGIPQGSVLGPLLFVIFINDLPQVVQSTTKIFADDTKLYRPIRTHADTLILQQDISRLNDWATKWQMQFNESKCITLHIGAANPGSHYKMNNVTLESSRSERDLGIIIDSKLKFHQQTAAAVSKANQILGIIRRSFKCLDCNTLPLLFKTLVRPHLEYCNCVWGPLYLLDIHSVERAQRRATKLVKSIQHLQYPERLKQLNLPSLQFRRKRGDMIQVFKIINNIDRVNVRHFFQTVDNRTTRGHPHKLYKHHAKKDCRRKFFTLRIINTWNSLPTSVVTADTITTFKNRLDAHWKDIMYIIDPTCVQPSYSS